MSGAKLVLASHGLLLYLGLPVCCIVHLFPDQPNFFFLGKVLPAFVRSGLTLCRNHHVYRNEEEGVLSYQVSIYLGAFLRILERVDVLMDDLHVLIIVLHLVLQC